MTQDDPKRPPRERVFAIIDQAPGGIEEKVRRLAEEFPQADTRYLAEIFAERDKELTAKADKLERECRATAAVLKYLDATGYDCLADACEDCGTWMFISSPSKSALNDLVTERFMRMVCADGSTRMSMRIMDPWCRVGCLFSMTKSPSCSFLDTT